MAEKDDAYGVEPSEEKSPDAAPDKSVHALDTCPNCSKPMSGTSTLLCLACGYDLKTMRVVETKTGEEVVAVVPDTPVSPLTRPGGPSWMPGALLATGLLVLVIATLAGWRGGFPGLEAGDAIPFSERLLGLARLPVLLAVLTASAMAGLITLAWLAERPFGDIPLATGRAAGIAAVAMTVTIVRVPWRFGELAVECIGATLVFYALTLVLFRTSPRDAAKAAALALVAFLVLVVGAQLVVWAM